MVGLDVGIDNFLGLVIPIMSGIIVVEISLRIVPVNKGYVGVKFTGRKLQVEPGGALVGIENERLIPVGLNAVL